MKKLRVVISTLAMAALVTGMVPFTQTSTVAAKKASPKPIAKVALVPLDDRPVNTYFPQMSARAGGVEAIMPDEDMLGHFMTPGDGEEIGDWLIKQASKVDGSVISVSMLAYGGLVASRTDQQSYEDALSNIEAIKRLRDKHSKMPIYVFDTIQRLAVTATDPETLKYYEQIREWAILYDEVHNLGMTEKKDRLDQLEREIPESVLEDYLNARERNHKINSLMIDWVEDGTIDYLVLAQDDAAPHGLHRAERETLVKKAKELDVEDRVAIFPGADEVGTVLLSRFALNEMRIHPKVAVEYSGIDGSEWTAPFEDTTFDVNVEKHIIAAGGKPVRDEDDADIVLMINSPKKKGQSNAERREDLDEFVEEINDLLEEGKQVAITDVTITNKADPELIERLQEEVKLPELFAYTAWGTAGNNMGSALGQALQRSAFLEKGNQSGVPLTVDAAETHINLLLSSFVNDHHYRNEVMAEARNLVKELNGNEWNLGDDYDEVNDFVRDALTPHTEEWYENYFANQSLVIGKRGKNTVEGEIVELTDREIKLPWERLFEVFVGPEVKIERE
ncbi:DUF4127 family protein [Brevibacillus sp. IT-7CA2]|uniref:DUF4127 family protein n=1 Tax=Brevibacillus sp. IT-7CA2 TaxID=3026436 RepID=UPI0039DFC43B